MYYLYQVNCVWVIGDDGGGGNGGGVGIVDSTKYVVCRDPMQPRFGHMPSCKPQSDYLSVPDVRKKCYKIPPENELCLCEDIFQQHQAKLVNCDMEDASAVESYKEPAISCDEENVCDECYCDGHGSDGHNDDGDKSTESSSLEAVGDEEDRKGGLAEAPNVALEVVSTGNSGQLTEKLTAEEREKVLRELDDILTGNFLTKVRRFSQDVQSDSSDDPHRVGSVGPPQLTAAAAARLRGKRSSSLDTDEIVNYGKMADLTSRFSRLGETDMIVPKHYCSVPNFFRQSSVHRYHDDDGDDNDDDDDEESSSGGGEVVGGGGVAGSSGDDYEVVRQPIRIVFIRPMSVSDDRLNRRDSADETSPGVVLTEVMSDGETEVRRRTSNAAQNRRRSFRKSTAFDSSLSSIDGGGGVGDCGEGSSEGAARYRSLGGEWKSSAAIDRWQPDPEERNYCKSSDTVSVSNLGRSHRRYSSVDVYEQVNNMFLDVEKTEKEFRDGLLAEKNRRHEAIREYLANKELLLMKMKSASVSGILRWNQDHQDTLVDDEDPMLQQPPTVWETGGRRQESLPLPLSSSSSGNEDDDRPPKDGLRRVLRTGLKGRRIRRLRKLDSRSSGLALADLWRISKDEPPTTTTSSSSSSSLLPPPHSTGCSSAEPPDNRNNITL